MTWKKHWKYLSISLAIFLLVSAPQQFMPSKTKSSPA
jgi:hypothetical protein